jgi:hypothetical protein
MEKLKLFSVFLKLTVKGESEMDAIESVYTAVDTCDLLDQDGIVGIEVVDDVEDIDEDDDYFTNDDEEE